MKIRIGYVSNSSSSSFICDVCGRVESGMDVSPIEFEMIECTCGHIICTNELFEKYTLAQIKKEVDETDDEILKDLINSEIEEKGENSFPSESLKEEVWVFFMEDFGSCEMPEYLCPICNMQHITETDQLKYLRKKMGLSREEINAEIRGKFKSYDDFFEYLKDDK